MKLLQNFCLLLNQDQNLWLTLKLLLIIIIIIIDNWLLFHNHNSIFKEKQYSYFTFVFINYSTHVSTQKCYQYDL